MIRNDPRMYSEGAVVFDTQPIVNMYANLMAKKQAKMEALDQYDKQRINNINGTGVRDQDREGLDQRVAQIQQFYQQNKDKIRKGGSSESYAYEKMFRDVSSYVNESKERTAKGDAAMKLYNERLKQDGRIPDDFINELHENEAGIDQLTGIDPLTGKPRKSKPLDITKWLSNPKPYNQQASLKAYADIKRTPTVRYENIPGQPLKQNEITEESFDNGAKQVIAVRAANDYQNSFSFAEQVKSAVQDPLTRKTLYDTFVKEYGTPPAQQEDYATAFRLQELQPTIQKVKAVDNKEAIMNKAADITLSRQKIMEGIKQGNRVAMANIRRGWQVLDQQKQDEILNDVFDGYKTNPQSVPEDLKNQFKKKDGKGHIVDFDEVVFTPDGKVQMNVYDVDKKGNKTINKTYSAEATVADLKERTRKKIETAQTNTQGQLKPAATGKVYQYNGKTFTHAQIEKAAKQSGISVDEYIKKFGLK